MPRLLEPGEIPTSQPRRLEGSFRDPSGFVFVSKGKLYRQVNAVYRDHYDRLLDSGLYRELTERRLLVPHEEAPLSLALAEDAYKVLEPERVPFVSYPYEWCFSELQDAARTTLEAMTRALERGMVLKDASAYNVQFLRGRPVLVDTLSFEIHREGEPWVAYRQFCQHFLAPLALASRVDARALALLRVHLDGVPLDLASRSLGFRTWLRPSLLTHVHLHSRSGLVTTSGRGGADAKARVSKKGLLALVESLRSAVEGLAPRTESGHWASYYAEHRYADRAFSHKKELVGRFLDRLSPRHLWDLGSNTGAFSELALERRVPTVAFDQDHGTVEATYHRLARRKDLDFLPLVLDLANPSPGLGWAHRERSSLVDRSGVDAVLALALVHHLAISNNVPLPNVASFFAELGEWLVVEFVPKEDEQAQRLLASRRDVFPDYRRDAFERAFEARFAIEERVPIEESARTLYLMRRS